MIEQDRELISPFPVPLLIIGSKYDLFQVKQTHTHTHTYTQNCIHKKCYLGTSHIIFFACAFAGIGVGQEESGLQDVAFSCPLPRRLAYCKMTCHIRDFTFTPLSCFISSSLLCFYWLSVQQHQVGEPHVQDQKLLLPPGLQRGHRVNAARRTVLPRC